MQGAISHPTALQAEGSWLPKLSGCYFKHETTDFLGGGVEWRCRRCDLAGTLCSRSDL